MSQNQQQQRQEIAARPKTSSLSMEDWEDNSGMNEDVPSAISEYILPTIRTPDDSQIYNPLVQQLNKVLEDVKAYREQAKDFYFRVLLSQHACPTCGDVLHMTGVSECSCRSGHILDPTIVFQPSFCCQAALIRQTFHYACSRCHKTVPSRFLFDERLFDAEYFREMMREHRGRIKSRRVEIKRLLAESRSGTLLLMVEPRLDVIPDFLHELDAFILGNPIEPCRDSLGLKSDFNLAAYRAHILSLLDDHVLRFSDISPLKGDDRQDRARRFITLVFMDNDREISLQQHGDDLLIWRYNDEADAEG